MEPTIVSVADNADVEDAVVKALAQAKRITDELFAHPADVSQQEDAETPDDKYFEFRVIDEGDVDDILSRNHLWHERIAALPVNVRGKFRLFIDAR